MNPVDEQIERELRWAAWHDSFLAALEEWLSVWRPQSELDELRDALTEATARMRELHRRIERGDS